MNFAVVKVSGKQFLVSEGTRFSVAANLGAKDQTISLNDVLLINANDQLTIGTPFVPKSSISAKIVSSGLGEKIRVAKFKAKSRYRRVIGFRPQLTTLEVVKITQGDQRVTAIKESTKTRSSKTSKK